MDVTPGLARTSATAVFAASGILALAGLVAGAVRVLPWLLDPAVPWRVAGPFARGLAAVALESALLVGWPLGWSIACFRLVESGQARVLQSLGERPEATVARLLPQGALLALALAVVALVYGRDAGAPGRVATELVTQSRTACTVVSAPTTYTIPFTNLTWLCAPGRAPRLVGSPAGAMASSLFSAAGARIAGDFRTIDLDDARIRVPSNPPVAVHVASLSIRGMSAWAQASSLPAPLRALVLVLSAWIAGSLGAYAILRRAARTRAGVLLIGAGGPLSSLGLMRFLERTGSRPLSFALVPLAGGACAVALAVVLSPESPLRALALRTVKRAASKK